MSTSSDRTVPVMFEQQLTHDPSPLAARLISHLPTTCPDCDYQTTRGNLKEHALNCPSRRYTCAAPNCTFKGLADAYLSHLVEQHRQTLLEKGADLFTVAEGTRNPTGANDDGEELFGAAA
ncbi:hypothetical protein HDV00_006188 [Rhizophlyctis rosea]|nr:hypothetical protein HDV00_006188 [Rhizophlyctis rosea]